MTRYEIGTWRTEALDLLGGELRRAFDGGGAAGAVVTGVLRLLLLLVLLEQWHVWLLLA